MHDPVLFLGSCEDSRAPVAGYFSSGHVPLPGGGACVLIWAELDLTLSGIIKRDVGGRLLMATVDAKSFQCHLM